MEYITHVAIKHKNRIYRLPKPKRHHDIIKLLYYIYNMKCYNSIQGFWTNKNRFLNHEEAAKLALYNKQCKKILAPPYLYSEDLW